MLSFPGLSVGFEQEEMRLEALGVGAAPSRPAYLPAASAPAPPAAEAVSGDAAPPAEALAPSTSASVVSMWVGGVSGPFEGSYGTV